MSDETPDVQAHADETLNEMDEKETDDLLEPDVEAHGSLWSISYRTSAQ
jgi:hypothetical protein